MFLYTLPESNMPSDVKWGNFPYSEVAVNVNRSYVTMLDF